MLERLSLFCLGGGAYAALELAWRGTTHWTMFLAGGVCLCLLQALAAAPLPLAAQPSGGFVLVGAIAAVWCAIANLYTNYKHEEVRRLYAKH